MGFIIFLECDYVNNLDDIITKTILIIMAKNNNFDNNFTIKFPRTVANYNYDYTTNRRTDNHEATKKSNAENEENKET